MPEKAKPEKALYEESLTALTAGQADVETSGHPVIKVKFTDRDGTEKIGFYKRLDSTYPALLAKHCVAISVILRMIIGERAAEERLVFNKNKEIVGSVSIEIPGFKPLQRFVATSAKDPLTDPSVETLLLYDVAELLEAEWRIQNDDVHPNNFSLKGIIDKDMAWYLITALIKGMRLVDGLTKPLPKKAMRLKGSHIDNFPINDDSESPTYSPAHSRPGNGNYTKIFKSYEAFRKLAANPKLQTEHGEIEFQEQLFTAFLKDLITYDKTTLKARLKEYLGDVPLDYKELPKEKQADLENDTEFGQLFNDTTNAKSFVKYALKVAYNNYQEVYRAVVFYAGCEKNSQGVPVVSFKDFLKNKPSALKKVINWIKEQNRKIDEEQISLFINSLKSKETGINNEAKLKKWFINALDGIKFDYSPDRLPELKITEFKKQKNEFYQKISDWFKSQNKPININPQITDTRYNLNRVMSRYNGVWRDSHMLILQCILDEYKKLIVNLCQEFNINTDLLKADICNSKSIDESNILSTAELFKEISFKDLSYKVNNPVYTLGFQELVNLYNELTLLIKKHADLPLSDLNEYQITIFIKTITEKIANSSQTICGSIGESTSWAKNFVNLSQKFDLFGIDYNLGYHFASEDKPLHTPSNQHLVPYLKRKHTEPDIIESCLKSLFKWAEEKNNQRDQRNGIEEGSVLDDYIVQIIKEKYKASSLNPLAKRKRGDKVTAYLKTSNESGDNKLACILSVGKYTSTSLNTKLIKYLINEMIKEKNLGQDAHLLSVKTALENSTFNAEMYAVKAGELARTEKSFTHCYSANFVNVFNEAMYTWIDGCKKKQFEQMFKNARKQYKETSWSGSGWTFFGYNSENRIPYIESLFQDSKNFSNSRILAHIFRKGGVDETSLNTHLFNIIVSAMKLDISSSDKKNLAIYKPISSLTKEREDYLLANLQNYAGNIILKIERSIENVKSSQGAAEMVCS